MATIDDVLAIRERWHTKNHPFFQAFAEGKLPLPHEQACMLRWASITDLYRREYLGEKDILPPGVS